jgi:NTP pyrophosphatase (non-canonical NTP hydrolase)
MALVILKMILPYLIKWLILEAEEVIQKVKSGKDKKARVMNKVCDFAEKTGLAEVLNEEKLSNLIDKKVEKYINKK